MSIGASVVVGLVVGFVANKVVLKTGDGLLPDVGLAVAGAVIAGLLFGAVSGEVGGLTLSAVLAGVAGAAVALFAYHRFFPHVEEQKPVRRSRAAAR
jgi:uncharacterized membrane protein YeaQ/YmgE (transglycosylase-associated protein family)